uniref:Uncharacterized protein n=1 Tax=Tanacetum cinerariifolium TaxID=118510 RepID=A0A6L2JJG2_TANCI|nr:hypothetical protein [Tanacetum cinerariifolium]
MQQELIKEILIRKLIILTEDLKEDPKEDSKEEPSEEEGEEEEVPLSSIVSASALPDYVYAFEETKPFEENEGTDVSPTLDPLPSAIDAFAYIWVVAPTPLLPPSSPLSPLSSPLPKIPYPPLLPQPPTYRDFIPQARVYFDRGTDYGFVTVLDEVNERVNYLSTSHRQDSHGFYLHHQDALDVQDDMVVLQAGISSLERKRRYHHARAIAVEQEATYTRDAWTLPMDRTRELHIEVRELQQHRIMYVTRQGTNSDTIEQLIARRVTKAFDAYDANRNSRSGNGNIIGNGSNDGDESQDSGTGVRRTLHTTRGAHTKSS